MVHFVLTKPQTMRKEAKRELLSAMTHEETQCYVGETNFHAPLRLSKILKHIINLGLNVNPAALSSYSSVNEKKCIMLSDENPSPDEKNLSSLQ